MATGGHELPNGDPDETFVWAVTVLGKVYFRQRVTINTPEGIGWLHIPTPDRCEVSQISIGPTGLVWAVTWHGRALVRLGITRLEPTGHSWSVLDPPGPSSSLSTVAVGNHVVWAIARDKTVWFRNGIHGGGSGESEALARGTKWVGMVGEMVMLSVGPLDQVIGILDDADRSIVIRTGVSSSDLSGKTWKVISAGISLEQHQSFGKPMTFLMTNQIEQDDEPIEKPKAAVNVTEDSKSNIAQGSSNDNFKKTATDYSKRIGNKATQDAAAMATRMAVHATVGRIPVAGPILASATSQIITEETRKVRLFDDDETDENGEASEIVVLTDKTFEGFISDNPGTLVMFYAPWCGHCKNLKPQLVSSSKKLKEADIAGKIAVVNCTKETQVANQFGISAFPNFKFFGQFETCDVKDIRSEEDVLRFMKSKLVKNDDTEEDQSIDDAIKEGEVFTICTNQESQIEQSAIGKSMFQSAMESHEDTPESEADRSSMASNDIVDREDHYGDDHYEDFSSGPQWVWLTMGSCKVDPTQMPGPWFVEPMSSQSGSHSGEAWRINILQVIHWQATRQAYIKLFSNS